MQDYFNLKIIIVIGIEMLQTYLNITNFTLFILAVWMEYLNNSF